MTGFVPLRRGLLDHLPSMTSDQVKLYVGLLLLAKNSGKHRGEVCIRLRELAVEVGWSKSKTHRELLKLRPTYVEIEPGSNQYDPTKIRILRFALSQHSGTPNGTALGHQMGQQAPNLGQHWDSTGTAPPVADRKHNDLHAPDREEGIGIEREESIPPTPLLLDWSPWPDAEFARNAILDAYPNKRGQAEARTYWMQWLQDAVDAPRQARGMFAAAKLIAERYPSDQVKYLPNARKFIEQSWADPWAEICEQAQPKRGQMAETMRALDEVGKTR